MPTPKKYAERNSVYTKTVSDLTVEFNVPRWIIRKAVENKQISSVKIGKANYLCPEEVERFLNKKALRLREFQYDNKDRLLGQIMGILSDYPQWCSLSDGDYNRMYQDVKKTLDVFFVELRESLEKENNPKRLEEEKRKRRIPK